MPNSRTFGHALCLLACLCVMGTKAAQSESWSADSPQLPDLWVRVCDGEPVSGKKPCRIIYELVDRNTKKPLVKVEFRDVPGADDQKTLIVILPAPLKAEEGVTIAFFEAEDWPLYKESKPFKVERVKTATFKPLQCNAEECILKHNIGGELWTNVPSFAGMGVRMVHPDSKSTSFPVPLAGFAKVRNGDPMDPAKYKDLRENALGRASKK